jgi:hypothetical protein
MAEGERRKDNAAQFKEPHAQVVLLGDGILLKEPSIRQVRDQAFGRGLVQTGLPDDIGEIHFPVLKRKAVKNGQRSIHGLDPVWAVSFLWRVHKDRIPYSTTGEAV